MLSHLKAVSLLLAVALVFAAGARATADGVRYHDEVFPSVAVTRNIAYGQAPDEHGQPETLLLDLYQPAGDTEPLRPALVWIHGGGFTEGNKLDGLSDQIAARFAKRGYVAVSINYRLREGNYFGFGVNDPGLPPAIADAQHDAQAAVRWLRANAAAYRIDANRIAVGGTSAGAVTALYVNYNASDPGDSGNPGYPSDVSACVDVAGAIDVALIDAGEPPVIIVHGTVDVRVPYSEALAIVARAREVGVTAEFHPIEGQGHGMWPQYQEQSIGWISDFLYRYVASAPSGAADASADGLSTAWRIALVAVGATALILAAGALYARKRHRGH